jgi:hypothetical protein
VSERTQEKKGTHETDTSGSFDMSIEHACDDEESRGDTSFTYTHDESTDEQPSKRATGCLTCNDCSPDDDVDGHPFTWRVSL